MVVTRYVFVHKLDDEQYLLINSLTGAVDIVETPTVRAFSDIRRRGSSDLPADKLEELTRRGYVYSSRSDEEDLVNRVVEMNERFRARSQAICFVICPTTTCNLRCPYCFEPHQMHREKRLMSAEQVEQAFSALDQIRQMRPDMPDAGINLFGGEPLLPFTRGVVAQVMAHAAARDLLVAITSNGTYAANFIDILGPHKERILFDISIDGIKEIHDQRRFTVSGQGTFDKITENIDRLLDEGFRVTARMNLNQRNVDAVPLLMEFMRDRGWSRYKNFEVNVSPVTAYTGNVTDGLIPPSELESRLRRGIPEQLLMEVPLTLNGDVSRLNLPLSKLIGESFVQGQFMPSLYYCEASGALFYCMGPDGYIYPCNQIIGDPRWAIGRYSPALDLDMDKAAMWQNRAVTNMPKCRECSIAFLCSGGCPVMATRATGSPMDSYCGTSKKELSNYIRSVTPQLLKTAAIEESPALCGENSR